MKKFKFIIVQSKTDNNKFSIGLQYLKKYTGLRIPRKIKKQLKKDKPFELTGLFHDGGIVKSFFTYKNHMLRFANKEKPTPQFNRWLKKLNKKAHAKGSTTIKKTLGKTTHNNRAL